MQYPNDIWFFDFEVFAHDWLVVFKRFGQEELYYFWNDSDGLNDFLDDREDIILCGFNSNNYDSYILKGALLGYEPEAIKRINDAIILDGRMGWELFGYDEKILMPPRIDLFQDIVPRKGLKTIQGNMRLPVVESEVSFTLDRELTDAEREDVLAYCVNDVRSTEALFHERKSYVDNKFRLCEMAGLDPFEHCHRTNASLVAAVLGAEKRTYDFEWYKVPDGVIKANIPEEVLHYLSRVNSENGVEKAIAAESLGDVEFYLGDCITKVGVGGIHGALDDYVERSDGDRVILLQDIASYYPSLILNNGYMSRSASNKQLFQEFYDMRIKAKHEGDKETAEAAKLVLNTTYGATRSPTNPLFDPIMGVSICMSGQLYIIDLISMFLSAIPSLTVIQVNTDGWMVSLDRNDRETLDHILKGWEVRTGFSAETVEIAQVFQRDVNNYLVQFDGGGVKTKGKLFTGYPEGTFKSNEMTVVSKAVVEYLLNGIPVETTIAMEEDVYAFQMIARSTMKYDGLVHVVNGVDVPLPNTARIYATAKKGYGSVYKLKTGERHYQARTDGYDRNVSVIAVQDSTGASKQKDVVHQREDGLWYKGFKRVRDKDAKTTTLEYQLLGGNGKYTKERVASVPESAIIDNEGTIGRKDIDDSYYVELAIKRLGNWYESEETMTEKKAPTKPKKADVGEVNANPVKYLPPEAAFAIKFAKVKKFLYENFEFSLDKSTQNGGSYASTQQYKVALSMGCDHAGLVHWFSADTENCYVNNIQYETSKGIKNYVAGRYTGELVFCDPDTGHIERMAIWGAGQDANTDHASLKASTYALRSWFLTTFLFSNKHENALEFNDEGETKEAPKFGFMSEVERAAKVSAVNTEVKNASEGLLNQIMQTLLAVREVEPTFGQIVYDLLVDADANGEAKVISGVEIPYNDAVSTLSAIEEKADALGVEV